MMGNGLLVLLVAMLAGFGLGMSLTGGIELYPGHSVSLNVPGTPDGWARMHTGAITNGLLVIVVALIMPGLGLVERSQRRIGWTLVAVAWANVGFYIFGNLAANRGLTFGDNRLGESSIAGVIAFVPAYIAAFVTLVLLVLLIRRAFASR